MTFSTSPSELAFQRADTMFQTAESRLPGGKEMRGMVVEGERKRSRTCRDVLEETRCQEEVVAVGVVYRSVSCVPPFAPATTKFSADSSAYGECADGPND